MKNLSLRFRITFWFTSALTLMAVLTYVSVLSVGYGVVQKTIKDNLIETVENNFVKVRVMEAGEENDRDAIFTLTYNGKLILVDEDFLDDVNFVYTSLYTESMGFIYGENPVARDTVTLEFKDSVLQTIDISGVTYYIFDRSLSDRGIEGLWIRGVVSENQNSRELSSAARVSLVLLPIIVFAASVGGYFIVKRMFHPIGVMSETAREIGESGDLTRRIEIGGGMDELHSLAEVINQMIMKLEKSFDSQRQFISDASHELKTPVAVISAQCQLSLEEERSSEEYKEALAVIMRQNRKMTRLIQDMLDFSRLEMGTEKYPMENVELSELLKSICADMALICERGILLTWEIEDNIKISGNVSLITRLASNLISNAYRYGNDNGHIWVRLYSENDEAILKVKDDGIGISEDQKDKIFDRFYQADASRSSNGNGLGLSMAREIARYHGGKIEVESVLGEGSEFTVTFKLL